jgi:hypothetical protein
MTVEPSPIFHVERSPLLMKAQCFAQMLKEDNQRIQKYLDSGGDPRAVVIDEPDPDDAEHIEMLIAPIGPEVHECMPPDETEFPPDGWRKATV